MGQTGHQAASDRLVKNHERLIQVSRIDAGSTAAYAGIAAAEGNLKGQT